jgi:hypothetical protein
MPDGQVGALAEGDAVELAGGIEHAVFEHAGNLEVGLHRLLVEGVALHLHLVGVELPVPRPHLEIAARSANRGVELGCLAALCGGERRDHLAHEVERGPGLLRHSVVHRVARPIGLAEQRRLACAEMDDLGEERAGVVGVAAVGAVDRAVEQRLARGSVGQRGERRLLRRVLQREQVLTRQSFCFGRLGRGGEFGFSEAGQRGAVGHNQRVGVGRLD